MKTNILTTVAAALIVGVAGITLATGTSATTNYKFNCIKVHGGTISKPGYSSYSGRRGIGGDYSPCMIHTVSTNHPNRPIRAHVKVRFFAHYGYVSQNAHKKCRKAFAVVLFYKRVNGRMRRVQTVKAYGVPTVKGKAVTKCVARIGTKYAVGSRFFSVSVWGFDGHGKHANRDMASVLRCHPQVH